MRHRLSDDLFEVAVQGVAQQHVYVRHFNYISHDSLNLRSLFCRESSESESRVQPSCQCLRCVFEQLV